MWQSPTADGAGILGSAWREGRNPSFVHHLWLALTQSPQKSLFALAVGSAVGSFLVLELVLS